MGKWETNIGNAIKNNSGGRVVIEENGVRHNKKVSVVRQVVGGVVKQVWNSFVLPTFDLAIKWNGGQTDLLIPASYTDSMGNVITVEMPRHEIRSDRCDFDNASIQIQLLFLHLL